MPGALEGWRAVLTVVLRYGMVQKQRIEYTFLAPKDPNQETDDLDKMDVDSVKAMVTGVKARGVSSFGFFYLRFKLLIIVIGERSSQIRERSAWLIISSDVVCMYVYLMD